MKSNNALIVILGTVTLDAVGIGLVMPVLPGLLRDIKSVQPSRLPEHETTWAMTVHKSQGSEFDHAALILPSQRTPVVTRELVYTAVTRARRRLSLYADERILSAAIATRTERRSGLAALFSSRE
ncbi:hypothetical protein Ecod37b_06050 [Escherichia coli str. K-12 substr. MG1655]|nr:hypothetical protein Ecod33a_06050 [Escherichia coli str. K-12 substr. MG1655]BDZ09668.1 hypothetical protein Ecod33b_06080 [Escherichia coli str. K-12 substr. MG1655]BDZ12288.1 hypothetical protein Ecod37b_06050 [Escherichia coli str. K-12 substr. MG1655]BDZ14748.1 hypothetical protein Ecod37c13_06100 [Escherichia coli str. K-12 substr. MG1655]BDZ17210.1 hypothetical protein Ecod37c143_06050 [Escherichia coli str. K-12 substr. MG1655]